MSGRDLPTAADVRTIAGVLAARYGGSPALRAADALEQALLRPHLRRHPDVVSEAAALMEGFDLHRPFAQGNHRVMLAATDVFMRMHGWHLAAPPARIGEEMVRMLRANAFDHARLDAWLRAMAVREPVA